MNEIKYSVLRFQIEELKNDNALLRAQLQQHGIEVNGDATPQWLWTGQVQDHKHRVASSHTAERHQERSKKKRKEEITGDNFCLKLDQRNTQKAHEGLQSEHVSSSCSSMKSLNALKSVNWVANWTSHFCFKEIDLCTPPPRCRQTLLFTLNYEPATQSLFLASLRFYHHTNFFLWVCFFYFLDMLCLKLLNGPILF